MAKEIKEAETESFIFYRSFWNAISKMNDDDKLQSFNAICAYALDGKETTSDNPLLQIFFDMAKPQIDANKKKKEIGRIYGAKGGRPKKEVSGPQTIEPVQATKRFVKPTIQEIKAYCDERKNNVDAVTFFNFYESKGWKVGSNPMKDWKASVRTWEGHQRNNNNGSPLIYSVDHSTVDSDYYSSNNYEEL